MDAVVVLAVFFFVVVGVVTGLVVVLDLSFESFSISLELSSRLYILISSIRTVLKYIFNVSLLPI